VETTAGGPIRRSTADEALAAELAEFAIELAEGAGQLARAGARAGFDVCTKSSATDVVTEVDRNVERWLVEQILNRRPADGILGEEGAERASTSSVRWVLDPIDGTVNFTLGLPQYAVSVAVELNGVVVAGCVYNPESGESFRARVGHGAFLGDVRLFGPRDVDLARAVVGTGFGYDAGHRAAQAQVVARLLGQIGDIRRLGAASLDLCAVAAGRLDGYYEVGLNPWDYAAGLLIVTEAGCQASGLRGRGPGEAMVAVAGRELAPALFRALSELNADL
jgi:myo-inositol-1(or 4)-monophosphatase